MVRSPSLLLSLLVLSVSPGTTTAQKSYWTSTNGPYWGAIHSVAEMRGGTVYAASTHGLYRLDPGASHWESIERRGLAISAGVSPFNVAVDENGVIYTGANMVYRIDPESGKWESITSGLNLGFVRDIAVRQDHIYLVSDEWFYTSGNGGETWTKVSVP